MKHSSFLAGGCLLFCAVCFGQTPASDSQTLQALLSEVRQLRQDLQKSSLAAQRTQILLHRLQGQEAAVARASQHLDEAREMLAGTQSERKHLTQTIKEHEDFISDLQNPLPQRKAFEDRLSQDKARLESFESLEQQQQARESDAERQLRAEQNKLDELHEQLEQLDKELEVGVRCAE